MKSLKIIITSTFLLAATLFFFTDSTTITLFFNASHLSWLDKIVNYISFLGDRIVFISVGIVMYFYNKKKFLPYPLSFINFTIIVQFFKRIAFADSLRPSIILPQIMPDVHLNFIPHVKLEQSFSFPSGHATMIFSLVILLIYTFEIKNIFTQITLILMAIFVCMARIYLLQHFFRDVYFGALVGSITTFFTIFICEKYDLRNKEPFKFLVNLIKF